MSGESFKTSTRFEGTLGAQSLPVLGADRHRDRRQLMRLVVGGTCMFWTGVFVAVVVICG